MRWDSPQFILTVVILAGWLGIVALVLFAPLSAEKLELAKSIIAPAGAACLLAIGYWFSPSKSG
jgi:hypothetical protein